MVICPFKSLYYSGKVGRSLMIGFGAHRQGGLLAAALGALAGIMVIPIGHRAAAQDRPPVFRVNTEVVQTDVALSAGSFVNGFVG